MSLASSPAAYQAPAPATFSSRAVFLMLLLGLIGFVGLGVLGAYAPMLRGGAQGGADALSRSALGYAGVVRVLRDSGYAAEVSRDAGAARARGAGLLVLTPPTEVNARDLSSLVAASQRTVLVVAPKWTTAPDPRHPGWVMQAGLEPPQDIAAVLGRLSHATQDTRTVSREGGASAVPLQWVNDFAGLGVLPTGRIDRLQAAATPGAEALLQDAAGRPVLSRIKGRAFVLADPDLLDNQAMATPQGARAAVALLDELRGHHGPIVFDVTLNGFGRPRSLLALALAPPFLGASLCALAAALLMGAHAVVRFGPARQGRVVSLGKQALLDNSAQLIALARREPSMGRRYAALARRRLARRALGLDAPPQGAADRLDAAIDRLLPSSDPPFAALASQAEQATDVTSLMRAVTTLHQRQTEILT